MKTLFDYLQETDGEEVTVFDVDYDIEVYFYRDDEPSDDWDKSMVELSKLLYVVRESENGVTVDLSTLIERHLGTISISNLFNDADLDDIMDDIEAILAGNVSENWFKRFVEVLK